MENKNIDISLLLLRITFGGLMLINHGLGKFDKFMAQDPIKFADPIGIGMEASLGLTVFGELICPLLIVVGLFTRWVSIPALITMLVAIFVIHWADPFGDKEKAILFAVPYLIFIIMGAGRYSIDHWWEQKRM